MTMRATASASLFVPTARDLAIEGALLAPIDVFADPFAVPDSLFSPSRAGRSERQDVDTEDAGDPAAIVGPRRRTPKGRGR
jgi:hypothetical protein